MTVRGPARRRALPNHWPATWASPRRPGGSPKPSASVSSTSSVNSAGTGEAGGSLLIPDEDWYAAWELNDGADVADAGGGAGDARARLGPGGERLEHRGQATLRSDGRVLGREGGGASSLSRLYADRCAPDGVLVNAICLGPVKSVSWMEPAARPVEGDGYESREQALEAAGARRPDRATRGGRGDRRRDRLPLLRARLLCRRRRLERRRRHRSGDHLWAREPESLIKLAPCRQRARLMAKPSLHDLLPPPAQASRMDAPGGRTDAAVLIPMHGWPGEPRAGLHRAAQRPAPPCRRGLPRPAQPRRGAAGDRPPRGRGGNWPRPGESRDRRMPAAGGHLRHRLQDPPLRRADRRGAALRAQPRRGRERPRRLARGPAGRLRQAPAGRGMPIKTDSVARDALIWGARPPRSSAISSSDLERGS